MKIFFLLLFTMVFAANASFAGRDRADISWGALSNNYQIGVSVQPVFAGSTDSVNNRTIMYLGTTNIMQVYFYCPPETEIFSAVLHDSAGKVVPKTRFGKKFGKTPKQNVSIETIRRKGAGSWKVLIVPQQWDVQVGYFNLADHFKIQEPGDYILTIEVRAYKKDSKGNLQLAQLSPCSVRFRFD